MVRSPCVSVSARTTRALKRRWATRTALSIVTTRWGDAWRAAIRDAEAGAPWARTGSVLAESTSSSAAIREIREAFITRGR